MSWDGVDRRLYSRPADSLTQEDINALRVMRENFVQLSEKEANAMRDIVEFTGKVRWLMSVIKGALVYLVGIAGGLSLISDDAAKLIKNVLGE